MLSLSPTIFLGSIIFIFGTFLLYHLVEKNVERELRTVTFMVRDSFDLAVRGDYKYENDILTKGEINIADSSMLYSIKREALIDASIFWEDFRVISTAENEEGVSAVGYKADEDVVNIVLREGNDYFKKKILINEREYMGFYTPLKNEDGSIVGMIASIIPVYSIYQDIENMILFFLVFIILLIIITTTITSRFSSALVWDIESIKHYLESISNGNLLTSLNKQIINRRDELGEIGLYAAKMRNDLKVMIELDSLTTLYNRRTCHMQIGRLIEQKKSFTIVMCDIDYFKRINDNYGHACGDYILIKISEMMKKSVGEKGIASRWGGEEFLLVYEYDFETVKEKVQKLMEEIRDYIFEYEGQEIHVTMTFGLKEMKKDVPYEKIINAADNNLYEGKQQGRNRMIC